MTACAHRRCRLGFDRCASFAKMNKLTRCFEEGAVDGQSIRKLVRTLEMAFVIIATPQIAFGHGVVIGQDGAGHLVVHVEAPQPLALPLSIFPGIIGWAAPEPGITAAEIDEPDEGLFMLAGNCNIQFELISFDPGVQVVTSHVWVAGETADFGPPAFDYHLIFNIPAGDAGEIYELSFKVRDLAGVYTDSPVITLVFSAGGACHCAGDFDDDDVRTGLDIQSFVNCMLAAIPEETVEPACGCADMDGDGALDGADVNMFVNDLLTHEHCH